MYGASPCSITTGAARSGTYGCDVSNGNYAGLNTSASFTSGRHYFLRVYMRWGGFGSTYSQVQVRNGSTDYFGLRITTSGVVQLWRDQGVGAPVQVGSDGPTLATDRWYRLDLRFMVNTASTSDYLEGRVNGETFASGTVDLGNTLPNTLYISGGATSTNVHLDDVAMNDDQGTDQNSWPPEGRIVHLWPMSDSAVGTGWQKPGGATTGLYSSVDNRPPQGIADSTSGTNAEKQIRNATSTTTGNYDANVQSYEEAGITANDRIVCLRGVAATGSSSATDTAGAIRMVSNPADGADNNFTAFDNGIAGTYPTNWPTPKWTGYFYAPAVTRATRPVLRIGKRTNTTRVALVCQMSVQVEYEVGLPEVNMAKQADARERP